MRPTGSWRCSRAVPDRSARSGRRRGGGLVGLGEHVGHRVLAQHVVQDRHVLHVDDLDRPGELDRVLARELRDRRLRYVAAAISSRSRASIAAAPKSVTPGSRSSSTPCNVGSGVIDDWLARAGEHLVPLVELQPGAGRTRSPRTRHRRAAPPPGCRPSPRRAPPGRRAARRSRGWRRTPRSSRSSLADCDGARPGSRPGTAAVHATSPHRHRSRWW